jgi:hypothetical protein
LSSENIIGTDFQIFHLAVDTLPERWFVIPSEKLQEVLKSSPGLRKSIYLSAQKRPVYKNRRPKFDYWQFEDAWHLIKEAVEKKLTQTENADVS